MKQNRTLYIDVTQLVHWPGKLTGIPRVMNELSSRYANDPTARFIIWNNRYRRFYEIDLLATLNSRGHRIHYLHDSKNDDNQSAMTKQFTEKTSSSTYKKIKKHAPGKRTFRRIVSAGQLFKSPPVKFSPGDTLFVLWGEWANKAYIDKLVYLDNKQVLLVQIAYDLLPILAPQYSGHSTKSMWKYYSSILPRCRLVLAISDSTKRDIKDWLEREKLPAPKIKVFRLGDDFKMTKAVKPKTEEFTKSGIIGKEYMLCVGTIEARKNHTLLYYVYKLAYNRSIELPKLIIVGRPGWKTQDIQDIIAEDPQTKNKVVFMPNVSDEELSWLYKNALFSLYPSFYEGWGLPVAESAMHGLPCLTSNTSSIPEIAGELVNYFDPASTDECLQAIQRLLDPAELEAAKKRISRYKPYSWDTTFSEVDKFIGGLDGNNT